MISASMLCSVIYNTLLKVIRMMINLLCSSIAIDAIVCSCHASDA